MNLSIERRAAEEAEAQAYAAEILGQSGKLVHWNQRNREIIARWSPTALLRIKRRAWAIVEGRAS